MRVVMIMNIIFKTLLPQEWHNLQCYTLKLCYTCSKFLGISGFTPYNKFIIISMAKCIDVTFHIICVNWCNRYGNKYRYLFFKSRENEVLMN